MLVAASTSGTAGLFDRPGGYGPAAVSRAFAGWSAAEIHRALNEDAFSGETAAVLRRVGRALAVRAGGEPDDDPFPSADPGASRRALRAEAAREAVGAILDVRNVPRSPGFAARLEAFADLPVSVLTRAALVCRGEDDFPRRLAAAARR